MLRLFLFHIGLATGLVGCDGTISNERARAALTHAETTPPVPSEFNYCYGHGCKYVARTTLTAGEWREIQRLFDPPSSNAMEERERLGAAVGLFETYVGAKLGTDADRGGTFEGFGRDGQLDCVDEATNTTSLLRMAEHDKLLKWHSVKAPVSRGISLSRWPHSTAAIVELKTEREYAVDSWFLDNGGDASVVMLEVWKSGWEPN